MSGGPRSQRLTAYHHTASGNSPSFTSPANMVVLVKGLAAHNASASATAVDIGITTYPGPLIFYASTLQVPANAAASWMGWVVLNPGDSVFTHTTGSSVYVALFGAVLLGAPPIQPVIGQLPAVPPAVDDPPGIPSPRPT